MTAWFTLLRLPELPIVPEFLRGAALATIDVTYLGPPEQARPALQPLEAFAAAVPPMLDSRAVIPVATIDDICQEPADPVPFHQQGLLLTTFGDAEAQALLAREGPGSDSPLLMSQIRPLGGALARRADGGGAQDHIAEPYLITSAGISASPELTAANLAHLAGIRDALADALAPRRPYTLLGPEDCAADALPDPVFGELRRIKHHRDPEEVIRANHPILAPRGTDSSRARPSG